MEEIWWPQMDYCYDYDYCVTISETNYNTVSIMDKHCVMRMQCVTHSSQLCNCRTATLLTQHKINFSVS